MLQFEALPCRVCSPTDILYPAPVAARPSAQCTEEESEQEEEAEEGE